MSDGTLARLFKALAAPADDVDGQAELGRLTRLLGLQEMLGPEPDAWVSVDPLHDSIERYWSVLGMPAAFEWVWAWTPQPIENNGQPVLICYIRRSSPTPNGCRGLDVPYQHIRAGEGFGIAVLGVVVSDRFDSSCWQISTTSGEDLSFVRLQMTVRIPGCGDVAEVMTPNGPITAEGPFSPSRPNETTLERARRALTMIPKGFGGRRQGWRKGQVWSARENAEWWLGWELDDDPKPEDYAAAIGVKDPDVALTRWRDSGLNWPPTTAQLNEFGDE